MNELEIYKKAKESINLINQTNSKYLYGFRAFEYSLNDDIGELDNMILFQQVSFVSNDRYQIIEAIYNLIEIGFSIVEKYPFKALSIFQSINDIYEKIGFLPNEILDLSVEIVIHIAKINFNEAMKVMNNIIEVDYFKLEALEKLDVKSYSQEIQNQIGNLIEQTKSDIMEYDKEYFEQRK